MESVNFREFRKDLAGYLRQARQGEEIVVTSQGEAVQDGHAGRYPVRRI